MATKQNNNRSKVRELAPPKDKGGRPRKEIDIEKFKALCALMCTRAEIASIFGIHGDTLDSRVKEQLGMTFSKAFEMYAAHGKVSLRRLQFKQAQASVPMSIHLGKQYLGQSEKISATQENPLESFSDDELDQLEKEITAKVSNAAKTTIEAASDDKAGEIAQAGEDKPS